MDPGTLTSKDGKFLLEQIYYPYYKVSFTEYETDLYTVASFAKYGYVDLDFVKGARESGLDTMFSLALRFGISYKFLDDPRDYNYSPADPNVTLLYKGNGESRGIYPVAVQRINGDIMFLETA